jgi:mercuric ion binding protein
LALNLILVHYLYIKKLKDAMKSLFILFAFVLLSVSNAQSQTASKKMITKTIKVYGNCGMCKTKIENKLSYTAGVKYGEWDIESKMLTVKFNPSKVSLEDIKKALADTGYDSDTHRATDKAYNGLHGCCKYERPKD